MSTQITNSGESTGSRKAIGARTGLGTVLAACMLTIASFVFLTASASAVYGHQEVETSFNIGPECGSFENNIYDIAVDETHGWVYVSCGRPYPQGQAVKRFDLNGAPADFTAVEPYIEGNTITYDPGGEEEEFAGRVNLAVDNSSSINQGRLFVTSSPNVDIFNPSGEYFTDINQPLESTISNSLEALDVGPDGSIYVGSERPGGRVSKYNPALQEVKRFYSNDGGGESFATNEPCDLGVDSTGALWLDVCFSFFNSGRTLLKYEADQFTNELSLTPFGTTPQQIAPFVGKPSPYMATSPVAENIGQIDIDLNTNDVYVDHGNQIEVYSQGSEEEPIHMDAPPFGNAELGGESFSVAVTKDNHVYASKGSQTIVRFGPGQILPDLHTYAADTSEVGHTSAVVKGRVERAGGTKIVSCKFEYGHDTSYGGPGSGSKACSPPGGYEGASTEVEAELTGLETGTPYHYRLVATNEKGENFGIDRLVIPAYVLNLQTLPAEEVDTEGAELTGSFDPDGLETEYYFEYGINTSYGLETEVGTVGASAAGVTEVGETLSGLPSGKVFHYRIVATNENGTTIGTDRTFRTGSTPDISGVRSAEVGETSATLKATINPVGFESKYLIEYGPSLEYGHSAPATFASLGSGNEAVEVSQSVSNLQPGVTYHFRVVAENKWGKQVSPDTTFDYAPPACPNDHVRQQSGASYLPDCRAYELVSPGAAGAVLLFPSGQVTTADGGEGLEGNGNNTYNGRVNYILNRGFASSPSRFSFYGGVGTINGIYSPTSRADMYISTRTPTGWVTTLPGLDGHEAYETGRKECSESMALCIDHSESETLGFQLEWAPYLYSVEGKRIGRLPTNVSVIPNGTKFRGWQRMSGDFSHFVFSSSAPGTGYFESGGVAVPFAPGGLTSGVGSAYDNDIANRTVKIISKLPNGKDIPTLVEPENNKAIAFPGVSPDGSHILMSTYGAPHLQYLYMSVNDAAVMEVGLQEAKDPETEPEEQQAVEPIGMTRDGSKVLFSSMKQMTVSDTDSSRDIFMWSESTGKLTRISKGNHQGNGKSCNAAWTNGCNAQIVTPEFAHPNNNEGLSTPTSMDDQFAEDTGDVFFYSPELLDPNRPGILNQKNLYDYHDGAVQLVATLEPGTEINRLQISPDGAHAALLTKSNLTTYDSHNFKEMYAYDANTGEILCASCNPSGQPPTSNVRASEGGRFMADDGRAFFTTSDSLVPRDRDGNISDVYEYVGGRPQLITSGLGSRDFTGGSSVISLFSTPEYTGLESVSHDGTDAFFSTYETLVGEDHNGEFVKFYDARTGGGFDESPALAPCAAADECHGVDSGAPTAATVASGATVAGGNVQPGHKKKKHKHQKKRTKRAHKRRHHG